MLFSDNYISSYVFGDANAVSSDPHEERRISGTKSQCDNDASKFNIDELKLLITNSLFYNKFTAMNTSQCF